MSMLLLTKSANVAFEDVPAAHSEQGLELLSHHVVDRCHESIVASLWPGRMEMGAVHSYRPQVARFALTVALGCVWREAPRGPDYRRTAGRHDRCEHKPRILRLVNFRHLGRRALDLAAAVLSSRCPTPVMGSPCCRSGTAGTRGRQVDGPGSRPPRCTRQLRT